MRLVSSSLACLRTQAQENTAQQENTRYAAFDPRRGSADILRLESVTSLELGEPGNEI